MDVDDTAGAAPGRRFAGQTALITGASRGIGLAIAARIVAEGGRVILTARQPEGLAEAVVSLGGAKHAIAVAGRADHTEHQAEAVATASGSRRWAAMMPRAANTPHTPPMRICPANMPAVTPVRAKQRFAPTPNAAPKIITRIMPNRRATITATGMSISSIRGWMPITAPLTTVGRCMSSCM